MATSAPAFRKTSLRTAVFASRWRHIPTRCPLKSLAAANLREILASTGIFSRAHASLTRPVGARAESLTRLKTRSRWRVRYSNYILSSVQIFRLEFRPEPLGSRLQHTNGKRAISRQQSGKICKLEGTAAMYNKEREHATVKLTGSIRE